MPRYGWCGLVKHGRHTPPPQVICNGEEVMTVAGTIPEYNVDIWAGNHPFYQGQTGTIVMDEGRVNRFKRRFDGLDSLSAVSTVSSGGKAPTKKEMRDAVAKLTGKAPPTKKGKK